MVPIIGHCGKAKTIMIGGKRVKSETYWRENLPLSLTFNLQPVKRPQLNKDALPSTSGSRKIPHICTSKGVWVGTHGKGGTKGTVEIVTEVLYLRPQQ